MSKIKHPPEKKRASLEYDHRVFPLEGNKTFRKAWTQKKRRISRKDRRADSAMLRQASSDESAKTLAPRKRTLKKFGITSLSQAVAIKEGKGPNRFSDFRYSSSKVTRWKQG